MKKLLLLLLFCTAAMPSFSQYDSAYIERNWPAIATDTALTYQQIVTICDSMFALAGYFDTALPDTSEADTPEEFDKDGSPFALYCRWREYWAGRCDAATGKPHDFMADAIAALNQQNKTTSGPNCAGASALQSSLASVPQGWQYIGPRLTTGGTSHGQHLG